MSISWETAARYMAEASNFDDTNLELNKKLYIAQMFYMGANGGKRLIDSSFQAWDFGPVLPALYHRAKIFGGDEVSDVFFEARCDGSEAEKAFVQKMSERLSGWTASQLVAYTHQDFGAWAKNYQPGRRHVVIPDKDILDEYEQRRRPSTRAP